MSKNFKNRLTPLFEEQLREQIEQDKYYQKPGPYPARGNGSLPGAYPGKGNVALLGTLNGNGNGARPGVYRSNRSLQFKAPVTPFPNVPETSLSNSPSMPDQYSHHVDKRSQESVKYYADWLAKKAMYDILNDNSKELNDYIDEATKIIKVGGKEVANLHRFDRSFQPCKPLPTGRSLLFVSLGYCG